MRRGRGSGCPCDDATPLRESEERKDHCGRRRVTERDRKVRPAPRSMPRIRSGTGLVVRTGSVVVILVTRYGVCVVIFAAVRMPVAGLRRGRIGQVVRAARSVLVGKCVQEEMKGRDRNRPKDEDHGC